MEALTMDIMGLALLAVTPACIAGCGVLHIVKKFARHRDRW